MLSGLRRVCMLLVAIFMIKKNPGRITHDAPGLGLSGAAQQDITDQPLSVDSKITSLAQAARQ